MPEAVEVEEVAVDLEAVGAEDLGVAVHPDSRRIVGGNVYFYYDYYEDTG